MLITTQLHVTCPTSEGFQRFRRFVEMPIVPPHTILQGRDGPSVRTIQYTATTRYANFGDLRLFCVLVAMVPLTPEQVGGLLQDGWERFDDGQKESGEESQEASQPPKIAPGRAQARPGGRRDA